MMSKAAAFILAIGVAVSLYCWLSPAGEVSKKVDARAKPVDDVRRSNGTEVVFASEKSLQLDAGTNKEILDEKYGEDFGYADSDLSFSTMESYIIADFQTKAKYLLFQLEDYKAYAEGSYGLNEESSGPPDDFFEAKFLLHCARGDNMFADFRLRHAAPPHVKFCGREVIGDDAIKKALEILVSYGTDVENVGSALEAQVADFVFEFVPKSRMNHGQRTLVEKILLERALTIRSADDFEDISMYLSYFEDEPAKQMAGYLHLFALNPDNARQMSGLAGDGLYGLAEIYNFLKSQGHDLESVISAEDYIAAHEYRSRFFPDLTEEYVPDYSSWLEEE